MRNWVLAQHQTINKNSLKSHIDLVIMISKCMSTPEYKMSHLWLVNNTILWWFHQIWLSSACVFCLKSLAFTIFIHWARNMYTFMITAKKKGQIQQGLLRLFTSKNPAVCFLISVAVSIQLSSGHSQSNHHSQEGLPSNAGLYRISDNI